MTWVASRPAPARLSRIVGRLAAHTVADRLLVRRVTNGAVIPPRLAAVTPAWLSAALGTPVRGFRARGASSATSVRATLAIEYETPGAGPATVFAKTTPSLVTRLANGASETSLAEARFMTELRPQLGPAIEIPIGHHCAADVRSGRSVQLLEDLVATKGATFPGAELVVDRAGVEDALDLLADVHRTFAGRTLPGWLRTQPDWWTLTSGLADLRQSTDRYLHGPLAPAGLADGTRVWHAFERSVGLHHELRPTLLHADPHPANWYVTGSGRMGLCDWQCVSSGHWSLDVAYALVTLLTVDQRRAWERDLLDRYRQRSGAAESQDEAWTRYRQQVPGALLKWAPTLHRPRGFPEMQPQELAERLLQRIGTAMVDLDVLAALDP